MKKYNRLIISILMFGHIANAQTPIAELNKKLGKGINMGNMFEAPTETEWGNPFKDDYFQRIASLGFNHVRIPVRWDTPARTLQTEPYTINPQFLERIKYVIDKALSEKLYVVLNMHHHEEIFQNADKVKPRFLSQWQQIATYFKSYDNRVLFEVMNEPNTNLTAEKWNVFFAEALAEIRKTNKNRAVLMGTANWGGLNGVSALKIPKDENLILTVHYYDPFIFTHQGAEWVGADAQKWLGTKWENTTLERDEIANQFQYIINFSKQNNIPVHVGEFGAYNKADIDSRLKWTNFLARWFELQGFSWAYWEFSAGFGIYNPTTNQYLMPLVDALLTNPLSPAVELKTQKIYESKFDAADAWSLGVQPQAKAMMSRNNGEATIDVSQASTDGWHVQLIRNDISLKKNSRYLVTFEATASSDLALTNYIGKNSSPYNAYSGYKGFTLTNFWQKFTYIFTMSDDSDLKSRIVFDLANKVAKISIRNLIIQEILPTVMAINEPKIDIEVFPNPTQSMLELKGIGRFTNMSIIDLSGRVLQHFTLYGEPQKTIFLQNTDINTLNIVLYNQQEKLTKKIVIKQ